jgi:hypothetical protein
MADSADTPLKGNKLSPKELAKAIKADEAMARRTDVRGSNLAAAMRLRKDSEQGRYANPEFGGDLGQFLKKGGSVSSASSRADGCAQRGKTRGKIR